MTIANYDIKCAKCNVSIKGPVDTKPESIASCPVCGLSDTRENIEREVADYVSHKTSKALDASLERIARGSKFMTYKKGAGDDKVYRFVVDFDPQL